MGYDLRLALGMMGDAASFLLYASPILTFKRVIKKRSTEEFSCVPYILGLFSCLLYTWYSLPVVSLKWENYPITIICGSGSLLESSYIIIYLCFTSPRGKRLVSSMVVMVMAMLGIIASVSAFTLQEHHHRKVLVGSAAVVATVAMYASPMVAVKQMIETKSVEFMPFYLSFFTFVSSLLWIAYGLLGRDFFVASPCFLGVPLGFIQLVLYCMYRRKRGISQQPDKLELGRILNVSKIESVARNES